MENAASVTKPSALYWIVAGLGMIWNAFGGYDYWMTRARNTDYLSQMGDPQIVLGWVDSFPIWAQMGWGLGVWGSVLGSILMLARSRHAINAFMASLIGALVSFGHQFTSAIPPELDGPSAKFVPLVIIAVVIALWWYCRRAAAQGWLK